MSGWGIWSIVGFPLSWNKGSTKSQLTEITDSYKYSYSPKVILETLMPSWDLKMCLPDHPYGPSEYWSTFHPTDSLQTSQWVDSWLNLTGSTPCRGNVTEWPDEEDPDCMIEHPCIISRFGFTQSWGIPAPTQCHPDLLNWDSSSSNELFSSHWLFPFYEYSLLYYEYHHLSSFLLWI